MNWVLSRAMNESIESLVRILVFLFEQNIGYKYLWIDLLRTVIEALIWLIINALTFVANEKAKKR